MGITACNGCMNYNAAAYFRSAYELGLSVKVEKEIHGFQFTLAKQTYFFRGGNTPFNMGSSNSIADNKYCANKILAKAGIPVPKATAISKEDFESNSWTIGDLKFPLVIKPMTGTSLGKDVLCNIKDMESLKHHLQNKFETYKFLSVEEFHDGLVSYRVLVFYGKVIGVVKRIPSQIVGDGKHNILELIDIENEKRVALQGQLNSFADLKIDEESKIILEELKLTPQDVPAEGVIIPLCYTCNLTRGGTIVSLGQQICKKNAKLACKAAKALSLNLVGLDLSCEDINIPVENSRGVFIEANYSPDITIHECQLAGESVQATKIMMRKFIYMHPLSYVVNYIKHKFQLLMLHINLFSEDRIAIKQ